MKTTDAYNKLQEFRKLEAGWDSYSAKKPDPYAIEGAVQLLRILGDGWTPVPCSDSSIQLEGMVNSCHVEILVQGRGY